MVEPSIYISRKAAQRFIDGLEASLRKPDDNPLLHHIYGIGGVGKSTLLQKIRDDFKGDVAFAAASFDVASLIDSPLSLMEHLYLQVQSDEWGDETFTEQYKLYKETLKRLETEPVKGKGSVDSEQVASVRNFVGNIAKTIASFKLPEKMADNVKNVAESAVDVAALALSEKEKWEQLLRNHPATKKHKELQALMADPLAKLTQTFAEGIIEKSQSKPIVLVLDTYEKASSEFDAFLCRYLIGNAFRQSHSIRIITAGRYSLKKKKYQRIFQSHGEIVDEYPLGKFDRLETQKYLNQIGIHDTDEIRRIFRMTKGLPYYLKVIKEQNDRGESVSFSRGRDEIADRLLHGLTSTERKVVQLAAHCRWFDRTIIKHLLKEKIAEIGEESLKSKDWFSWLKERDFVIEDDHYRIDDVMRDVIRAALCRDDERDFRDIHKLLANYFSQLADEAVSHSSHISEKYQDSEWKECMIEMTYHSLFASRNEGQHNLLTRFFEGAHFEQPDIARNSFTAIAAEAEFEENRLLPTDTKKFLNSIGSAIAFGWQVIGKPPSHYEFQIRVSKFEEPDNTTDIKEQIEIALRKCFQKSSSLSGLAKYVELSGKAVRCPQPSQRKKLLEQATKAIESVVDLEYPDFSSSLFCDIGRGFGSVDAFSEALVSYQAAAEIDPESYEAWVNQGNAFSSLERKGEALTAYDIAIKLDPDHYAAWNNKGNCLFKMGNYSEALSTLNKAIQLDPDKGLCWVNKGKVLTAMGLYEDALSSYDRAIELKPKKTIEYEIHKIAVLRLMRLYEKVVVHCDQFLKQNDDYSATLWNSRGLCLSLLQAYDEALLSLERAIETDESKGVSTSVANKCIVLARSGDCERALVLCEQYLQTNADEFGHYAQACCYAIQGNDKLALQALNRAIELNPNLCKIEARANPDFDDLRQNEQFKNLVDRRLPY